MVNQPYVMRYITADTVDECIKLIEKEHAPHTYQIKNQEKVSLGGFFGFRRHEGWKVGYILLPVQSKPSSLYMASQDKTRAAIDVIREKEKVLNADRPSAGNSAWQAAAPGAPLSAPEPAVGMSADEAAQFRNIMDHLSSLRSEMVSLKNAGAVNGHPTVEKLRLVLENNEFSPAYIRNIIDRISKEFNLSDLDDYALVERTVVDWIGGSLRFEEPQVTDPPQVMVLVGPTGVGKTTTVAKLAAWFAYPMLFDRPSRKGGSRPARKKGPVDVTSPAFPPDMNVLLVSIDSYRIQAFEQLLHYADIMDIEAVPVKTGSLGDTIASYGTDKELVLVDTIGYSPQDIGSISSMRERLETMGKVPDVFLAMSASTKKSDMIEIMNQFDTFGYSSVIVTKLDETRCVGNLISALSEKDKSIAFVTDGQKVPRNLAQASVDMFLRKLVGFSVDWDHIAQKFPKAE